MTRLFAISILVLVVLLAVTLSRRVEPEQVRVATTSETTPTTEWIETQPGLGHRFDEYRAAVERARAAHRVKRKAPVRVMRGEWPWDAIAECESGGNWAYNGSSGYDGGLQFHPRTWSSYGGGEFAPFAYQATREQQIIVAQRVLAVEGWAAWPTCSRKLGLR